MNSCATRQQGDGAGTRRATASKAGPARRTYCSYSGSGFVAVRGQPEAAVQVLLESGQPPRRAGDARPEPPQPQPRERAAAARTPGAPRAPSRPPPGPLRPPGPRPRRCGRRAALPGARSGCADDGSNSGPTRMERSTDSRYARLVSRPCRTAPMPPTFSTASWVTWAMTVTGDPSLEDHHLAGLTKIPGLQAKKIQPAGNQPSPLIPPVPVSGAGGAQV